jgi:hydroxybutyrate-dimer hydrolase
MTTKFSVAALAAAASLAWIGAVLAKDDDHKNRNKAPTFIVGDILRKTYNGATDDLATGGLGLLGLQSATLPGFANVLTPTAAELRKRAIYVNYRAIVDTVPGGGYGVLFGPGVTLPGQSFVPEKIAGDEYLALVAASDEDDDDKDEGEDSENSRGGRVNITVMVQVPDTFGQGRPCIMTAPSSGSRGVYGAIATGEWGLKRGCAVAYTDKGSGMGYHDLQSDLVHIITGERVDADDAGEESTFTADLDAAELAAFNDATPNRFAIKHAHSRINPEKDWGKYVIQSVKFAFHVLNENHRPAGSPRYKPENTLVIGSSISNGGGATVRAAERAGKKLFNAVVVSEPNVNPTFNSRFVIQQGNGAPLHQHSRSLYDYTTVLNVYQGCASRAFPFAFAYLNLTPTALGDNSCQSLIDKGLLPGTTLATAPAAAQAVINSFGVQPEQNIVQPSHWFLQVSPAVATLYANAYGRFSVAENVCGFSYGGTDVQNAVAGALGRPQPIRPDLAAIMFGTGNGVPPAFGVDIIGNECVGGATSNQLCKSASTNRQDQNLDGALCLRRLATGKTENGDRLRGDERRWHERVTKGVKQVRATGDLNGVPTIFVTGRADAILPINHTSRAYYGLNQLTERRGNLRYYEVTSAHHLDALNGFPGFNANYVPLHHYLIEGLNLMWAHLTAGSALPPSQVVDPTPRGTALPPLTAANMKPISLTPAKPIQFVRDSTIGKFRLRIPE